MIIISNGSVIESNAVKTQVSVFINFLVAGVSVETTFDILCFSWSPKTLILWYLVLIAVAVGRNFGPCWEADQTQTPRGFCHHLR